MKTLQILISKYKKPLIWYFISRLIFALITFLFTHFDNSYDLFYDNAWYLSIAEYGYGKILPTGTSVTNPMSGYAFFPLIPIILHFLGKYGLIAINQLVSLATLFLIYNIAENDGLQSPERSAVLYAVSPVGIFSFLLYTEPLFLFLTALSYYLRKKNKIVLSAITAGLSCLVRVTGAVFCIAMVISFIDGTKIRDIPLKLRQIWKKILTFVIVCLPISVIYPIYLFITVGDPLYFMKVQSSWGKITCLPGYQLVLFIINTVKLYNITSDLQAPGSYVLLNLIELIPTFTLIVIMILQTIKMMKKKNCGSAAYTAFTILLSTTWATRFGYMHLMQSALRYLIVCFPIYVITPNKKQERHTDCIKEHHSDCIEYIEFLCFSLLFSLLLMTTVAYY